MKQLIIGVMLTACLIGCTNPLELSLTESDTIQKIRNNKLFTKIEDKDYKKGTVLKFYSTPKLTSIFGIKTDDINVLGGYLLLNSKGLFCGANLTLKGKKSYQNILANVEHAPLYKWQKNRSSLELGFGYNITDTKKQKKVIVYYDTFADVGGFMVMNVSSECLNH